MQFQNIKINGATNPVGFNLDTIALSYFIDGKADDEIVLHIYDEDNYLVYEQFLDYAKNYETFVNFIPNKQTRYKLVLTCGDIKAESFFETGTDFDCGFITPTEKLTHPVIYKEFHCKNVRKARLYITGVGLYEASINGKKVGDEYLTPGCNNYREYLQYQTYDVTDYLQENNLLEIALGDGWYKGRFGLKHKYNIYGSEYACACKLVMWCDDGVHILRSDESFRARRSTVLNSGVYDGEVRDDTVDCSAVYAVKKSESKFNVIERISLPIKVKAEIFPKLIITPKGEKVLDFGQNFAGIVSFENFLEKGESITLKAGEVLQNGCFYRDNLRTAKAEFKYVSDGIRKTIEPKFTFFGFRYMLVECKAEFSETAFCGKALYSDLDDSIKLDTSDAKLNRLIQNCIWGQRSNFLDIPTDCPQRDERLGWTGDAEVFCGAACYQMDCRAFYRKYLTDIGVEQKLLNGRIASYAPDFDEHNMASSVWADAITIIPWTVYETYGDTTILKIAYPIMKRYFDLIIEEDNDRGGKRLYNFGFHLGDWLSQDGPSPSALRAATDEKFIASCYYYKSVQIIADTAKILGKNDDFEYYAKTAKEIYSAILKEYFTVTGRLAVDTQTAYVLCVAFDIYRDKKTLYKGFADKMKRDCYKVKGGFVGATKLVQSLFKSGQDEAAFAVLFNEEFPGWMYCVNLGATTIWERWNSLNADGKISGTAMNSLNHYSYGAVSEAVYKYISGIVPNDIAYKSVVISPKFNFRIKDFDFSYRSVSGDFKIKYNIDKAGVAKLQVTIPYGVKAILNLNGKEQVLDCGTSVFELPADNKLIHPFSVDSTIFELMNNKFASAIFNSVFPGLFDYIRLNPSGMEGFTWRERSELDSFSMEQDKFERLDRELKAISF